MCSSRTSQEQRSALISTDDEREEPQTANNAQGRVRVDEQRRRRARDEGMYPQMIRELQRPQVPPRPRRAVEDERTCVEINQ